MPKSSESETKYEEYGVKWPVRALKQVLSKNLLFHAANPNEIILRAMFLPEINGVDCRQF